MQGSCQLTWHGSCYCKECANEIIKLYQTQANPTGEPWKKDQIRVVFYLTFRTLFGSLYVLVGRDMKRLMLVLFAVVALVEAGGRLDYAALAVPPTEITLAVKNWPLLLFILDFTPMICYIIYVSERDNLPQGVWECHGTEQSIADTAVIKDTTHGRVR